MAASPRGHRDHPRAVCLAQAGQGRFKQVHRLDIVEARQRGHSLAVIARRHDRLGAGKMQHPCGFQPNARIPSGNDSDLAAQIASRG